MGCSGNSWSCNRWIPSIIFAIYAIHKIVEHNAGSSSGSPYGKLSCVRAVYSAAAEVPLFAVLITNISAGRHHDIASIVNYQSIHGPLTICNTTCSFDVLCVNTFKISLLTICNNQGKRYYIRIWNRTLRIIKRISDDIWIHCMVHAVMDILNSVPWTFKHTSLLGRNGYFNGCCGHLLTLPTHF